MSITKTRPTVKSRLAKIVKEISSIRKSLPQVKKVIVIKKSKPTGYQLEDEYQKGYDKGFDQGARSVRVSYGKKEHLYDLQRAAYLRGYNKCKTEMRRSIKNIAVK